MNMRMSLLGTLAVLSCVLAAVGSAQQPAPAAAAPPGGGRGQQPASAQGGRGAGRAPTAPPPINWPSPPLADGPIVLDNSTLVYVDAGVLILQNTVVPADTIVNSGLATSFDLTKSGPGELDLPGTNSTFSGHFWLDDGIAVIGTNTSLGTSVGAADGTTVMDGATLRVLAGAVTLLLLIAIDFALPRLFKISRPLTEVPSWEDAGLFNWPAVIALLVAVFYGVTGSASWPNGRSSRPCRPAP